VTGLFSCPAEKLAAEIEFAVAYTVACNRGQAHLFLLAPPEGRRGDFARQVAAMLLERAGNRLSGMAVSGDGAGVPGAPGLP
jgi:hypothetical protein